MDVPSIEYVPLYLRALGTGWMFVELANTLDNLGLQKALSTNGRIMVESSLRRSSKVHTRCFDGELIAPVSAGQPPKILAKNPLFARAAALSAAVHEQR